MEQVVADLIRSWRATGALITVVTAEESADAHALVSVPVIVVPGRTRRTTTRWTRDVARAVDWKSFDIVFGVSAAARSIARLRDRPPTVMQAHGTSLDEIRTKLRVGSPRALATVGRNIAWAAHDLFDARHYDAVVAVGPGIAATLRRFPPALRPRRTEVINNGVPVQARDTPLAATDQFQYDYLYVGRLHREKGVDLLVRAVRKSDLRVAIVGDGPQRNRLRRLAKDAPNIEFLGRRGPEEVSRLRARSRAAVMPSRRIEGLPLAALESLSAGRPVFASAGVVRAFAHEIPDGVLKLPLFPRTMRKCLQQPVHLDVVSLPTKYHADTTAAAYLQLFEKITRK